MRIVDLRVENDGHRARTRATVQWEDSERADFPLFVEAPARYAHALWADPTAYLVACVLPAWRHGEKRVAIEGAACPVLVEDIWAALRVLRAWYADLPAPPIIEPQATTARAPAHGGAISLLSCGVDSLATLRRKTLSLPRSHPAAVTATASVIFSENPGETDAHVCGRIPAAERVSQDCGADFIPVWTNLWWLVDNGYFFDDKWHGAVLSSLAHFFSAHYSQAYVGASCDGAGLLAPWGSSPLLDPYYSSAHFRIEHHGSGMRRYDKTALIAHWPVGLNNLRVCQSDSTGSSNCGCCEKCIRVMTALTALGCLQRSGAFSIHSVTAETIDMLEEWQMLQHVDQVVWYEELLEPLTAAGRRDLVTPLRKVIHSARARLL